MNLSYEPTGFNTLTGMGVVRDKGKMGHFFTCNLKIYIYHLWKN